MAMFILCIGALSRKIEIPILIFFSSIFVTIAQVTIKPNKTFQLRHFPCQWSCCHDNPINGDDSVHKDFQIEHRLSAIFQFRIASGLRLGIGNNNVMNTLV